MTSLNSPESCVRVRVRAISCDQPKLTRVLCQFDMMLKAIAEDIMSLSMQGAAAEAEEVSAARMSSVCEFVVIVA